MFVKVEIKGQHHHKLNKVFVKYNQPKYFAKNKDKGHLRSKGQNKCFVKNNMHEREKHSKGVILHVFEGAEFNPVLKFKVKGEGHKDRVKVITKIGLKLLHVIKPS